MADLTTLLSKFLNDLYAGTWGVGLPITNIKMGGTLTFTAGTNTGINATASGLQLLGPDAGAYLQVLSGVVEINSATLAMATAGVVGASITNGAPPTTSAATGLAITIAGEFRRVITKVTLSSTHAAYQAAALTADVTLCTLKAKQRLCGVIFDTTTAWAGTSGTLAFTVGKSAGGNEYILSHDVKSSTVTKGLVNGDLGAAIATSSTTPVQGGDLPSWGSTTAVQCRLTSGTGNLGTGAATNLTQGTTVAYIVTESHP